VLRVTAEAQSGVEEDATSPGIEKLGGFREQDRRVIKNRSLLDELLGGVAISTARATSAAPAPSSAPMSLLAGR
jgi:hypothetical protein